MFKVGDKFRGDDGWGDGTIEEIVDSGNIKVRWANLSGTFTWSEGSLKDRLISNNTEETPKKGNIMSVIKDLFKNKTQRATEHFEITNGNGGLTEKGRAEFIDYLWEVMKAERTAFEQKIVEAYEEATKK